MPGHVTQVMAAYIELMAQSWGQFKGQYAELKHKTYQPHRGCGLSMHLGCWNRFPRGFVEHRERRECRAWSDM